MSDNEENNPLKEPTDKSNDKVEITVPLAIKKAGKDVKVVNSNEPFTSRGRANGGIETSPEKKRKRRYSDFIHKIGIPLRPLRGLTEFFNFEGMNSRN